MTPKMLTRRDVFVAGAAIVAVAAGVSPVSAADQLSQEVAKVTGGKAMLDGKIKLDLPSIAENGLVVPLGFDVESPMSDAEYVRHVHFFAEGNPNPLVASFHFTSAIPKASGQIRIRLAQTQNVIAIAEMSDGKFYTARKEVKVTIGGCGG